jgi:hypothetical protein
MTDTINPKEWDNWNRANYRKQQIKQRIVDAQLTQEQHNEQALKKIREIRCRLRTTV